MLYFVRFRRYPDYLKVGHTDNLGKRLQSLTRDVGQISWIEIVPDGTLELEKHFHSMLKKLSVVVGPLPSGGHTEFYNLPGEWTVVDTGEEVGLFPKRVSFDALSKLNPPWS